MVRLVHVTGAKAPCPHWVLWGPDLVTAVWQLWDSEKQFALKRGRASPLIHPTTPSGYSHTLSPFSCFVRKLESCSCDHIGCPKFTGYHWSCYRRGQEEFAAEYLSFLCTIGALLHTCTPEAFSETCRDPHSVCNRLYPLLSFQLLPWNSANVLLCIHHDPSGCHGRDIADCESKAQIR